MTDLAKENPVLAAAIAQFDAGNLRHIDVPEWPDAEGRPTRIFYRPTTLADISALSAHQGDPARMIAETLVLKALNADGQKMFPAALAGEIMRRVDPAVASRIVAEINARALSPEAAEGN